MTIKVTCGRYTDTQKMNMHQILEETKTVRLMDALRETINDAVTYDGATDDDIMRAVTALAGCEIARQRWGQEAAEKYKELVTHGAKRGGQQ